MVIAQKPVTAEELFSMPDYGLRSELVQEEVRWMTPAGNVYERLAINSASPLFQYVRENDLGTVFAAETGFKIATDPDTVRAHDVAFVRRERVEVVGDVEGYWPGPPDLAVEVIFPNDLYTEVEEKVADWLEAGTGMVVVVNPRNKTVAVRRSASEITILREGEALDGADVVAGWSLSIRDIIR
ncbi:Uma2 family endonuclease [soil metagenome]